MDLNELRRLTLPKLRDLAKQETDLTGVIGMEKEALVEAIAKAKGISYEEAPKDISTIRSIKHDIQELKKQKTEILTSSGDRKKVQQIHRRVKRLKRLTRKLAHEAKSAPKPEAKPEEAAPPSAPQETPPETPPAAG